MFPWSRKQPLVLKIDQTFAWRLLTVKPTAAGYWLLALSVAVWIGALNYAISLAYALSFWLLSFLIISVLMVRQQLVGIKISRIECEETFAGDDAKVTLEIRSENKKGRMFYVIYEGVEQEEVSQLVQMQGIHDVTVKLNIPTVRRGTFFLPDITLFTTGPFGLMKTQLTFNLDEHLVIYPKPEQYHAEIVSNQPDANNHALRLKGEDDLSFLSEHLPGQSLRHISWKNYAKTGKMMDKNFESDAGVNYYLISYKDYPSGTSIDQMASFMCQRILNSEQRNQVYSVELPNQTINLQTNQRAISLNALGGWS